MENTNMKNTNPLIQYVCYNGFEIITNNKGKILAQRAKESYYKKTPIIRTSYVIGSTEFPKIQGKTTKDIKVDSYLLKRMWLEKLILTSDPTISNSVSPIIFSSRIKEIKEITNEQYTKLLSN
jgi:hypothetical protein